MSARRIVGAGIVACVFSLPGNLHAIDCAGLPTVFDGDEFPTGNFFSNFNNPCYAVDFSMGKGDGGELGDLNAFYNKLYFKVDPRYQLIIIGAFPNSRYHSITVYDEHSAVSQYVTDVNIAPLTSADINPYLPGVAFVGGQQYAMPVNFGGTLGNLQQGCRMDGFNVAVNSLDGTQRHPGMNWNTDSGFFQANPGFSLHEVDTPQHTNPNTAGVILIRSYLDITTPSYQTNAHVIVRDMASGCAYPAAYALNTLQIVTNNAGTGNPWLSTSQIHYHKFYANNYLPTLCWGANPRDRLQWLRRTDYTPGDNPASSYLDAFAPPGLPAALAAAGEVMRIRFRIPATPPTPCTDGCSRSGNEQMRYMSLSFQNPGGVTLASLADSAFTQDANGYVTLVVGTGAAIPAWITPANGYTLLDLTALANYQQMKSFTLRDILPAGTFNCAGQVIPYRTGEATTGGDGLMGLYAPVVDYPAAAGLPSMATPVSGPASCDTYPGGPPAISPDCAVLLPSPTTITSISSYCASPGCDHVVVQPQPPLTIVGTGFGSFPFGLPYTGNSAYLEVYDVTQNWTAGYGSDVCTLSISDWSDSSIALVANVNQHKLCPMEAGDQLTVQVWNPQTAATTSFAVTVGAGTQ
ncbi:MAG TPA: hypothetical protein VKR61_08975 [Bryobacteraceae bacterium]|nr:hypothetical protein [Bryobacteraceae bacterium]